MKRSLLFTLFVSLLFFTNAQNVSRLIGASPFQDSLWVIDTADFSITYHTAPTIFGGTITGTNGIARHPNTGVIYTINKQSGVTGRILCTFDINTSALTLIGNLGDNFSSITFRGDSLLGVTGDGATVPETVYLINTTDASKTVYRPLGNGADGEIISYNPDDDMVYHWSGNSTMIFEKFSPLNPADPTVNIPIIGATSGETFGSVYIGNNTFLNSNIGSSFNKWNTNGTVNPPIGTMPDDIRGTAFITCTRQLSGTNNYCVGDSTLLTVTNASSYQWYRNGLAIANATNDSLYVSQPGVYNCEVEDVCGTDTLGLNIVVQQFNIPTVALSGNTSYCQGQSTTLTGSSGGTSQWYLNGIAIPGATSNSFVVTEPGVYNMTKTNLNGCADSSAVGITVVENPTPSVALSGNTSFCQGQSVTLSGTSGGTSQWYLNGAAISGATTNSLVVTASGVYNMTKTNLSGCTDSAAVGINVVENPLPNVIATGGGTFCEGDPVTLSGSGGDTYSWDNGVTDGASFTPTHIGDLTYTVTGTDLNNCSNTDQVIVTVNQHSTATQAASGLDTYTWPVNGQTYTQSGTYTAVIPNAAGCDSTITLNLTLDFTGIGENESVIVLFYPNPTSSLITIEGEWIQNKEYVMLDIAGRIVLSGTFKSTKEIIDLKTLARGQYMLRMEGKELKVIKE